MKYSLSELPPPPPTSPARPPPRSGVRPPTATRPTGMNRCPAPGSRTAATLPIQLRATALPAAARPTIPRPLPSTPPPIHLPSARGRAARSDHSGAAPSGCLAPGTPRCCRACGAGPTGSPRAAASPPVRHPGAGSRRLHRSTPGSSRERDRATNTVSALRSSQSAAVPAASSSRSTGCPSAGRVEGAQRRRPLDPAHQHRVPADCSTSARRSRGVSASFRIEVEERDETGPGRNSRFELHDADRGRKLEPPRSRATRVHHGHHHVHQREQRPVSVPEDDDLGVGEGGMELFRVTVTRTGRHG